MVIFSRFSHEKPVMFHSYVNVYQRVTGEVIVIRIESFLRLGLSEVAQNLHNREGMALNRYPNCGTSRSTEILTTDRGRP